MIKNNTKYIKAFSLAEILLSVTIVAIILLLAMPVITKKSLEHLLNKESASAEFYYNETTNNNAVLPCYATTHTGYITTTVKENTGECQSYQFTIPNGVHKIDMTLVAGGGGGGGAAGGIIYEKLLTSDEGSFAINKTRLKSATINILTGAGSEGEGKATGDDPAISTRKGGNSGTAVISYNVPNDFILNNSPLDFMNTDYNKTTPVAENEILKTSFNVEGDKGLFNINFQGAGIMFEGEGYKSLFFVSDAVTNEYLKTQGNEDMKKASYHSRVACGINTTNDPANAIVQSFQGKDIIGSHLITSALCKLNPSSYKASVDGEMPQGLPASSTTVTSGKISYGGKGGSNGSMYSDKGNGGDGAALVYLCFNAQGTSSAKNCKWTSSHASSSITDTTPAGARYGEINIVTEHPGSAGAGGAGGSAVKIKNFVVRPGKTYTVVVGKGGAGGAKGVSGISPSDGTKGGGGSSTAIYDESNKLVLMVIGGAGGFGGEKIDETTAAASKIPKAPTSSRNVPMVIIGKGYESAIEFDEEIASTANITDADETDIDNTGIMADASTKRLIYSYMKNMVQPLFTLSTKYKEGITNTSYNFDKYNADDKKTGGFSHYVSSNITNISNLPNIFHANTYKYKGHEYTNIYSGFYFRYPVLNSYYYAGGLGGFSGLGTKAGCGGGFLGNYYGYTYTADSTTGKNVTVNNKELENTITMLKQENGTNTAKIFNTDQYFEGCTPKTTDGHTAKFKAPVVQNGKIANYGQAGSGGGGGGYNINLGPGNGADGQNGYVVITWKK